MEYTSHHLAIGYEFVTVGPTWLDLGREWRAVRVVMVGFRYSFIN